MAEAQAELQEMAAGMITEIGGAGDTLDRVEGYLQERRDKAVGRARVASSEVKIDDFELKEAEQQAMAEMALTEFEAAYGFKSPGLETPKSTEPQVAPESPKKELGPQES
jgi:phage shock protein A